MNRLGPIVAALVCGCASQPEPAVATTTGPDPVRNVPPVMAAQAPDASTASSDEDAAAEEALSTTLPDGPIERGCSALPRACADGRCDAEAIARRRPLRVQRGPVSYYGDQFHGRRTANGERYDKRALTAASRTLPFGALVRVRRMDRPESITIVRINDRGPFGRRGRILDLSRAAAECIDMVRAGVVEVRAEVIDWGPDGAP